jgi:hypothetical protein
MDMNGREFLRAAGLVGDAATIGGPGSPALSARYARLFT